MFVNGSTARVFTAGRRLLACLLALALSALPGLAAPALGEGKVFAPGETEPFSPDAKLLTVRVAGMKTGDCMLLTLGEASMLVDLGTGSGMDKIREMLAAAGLTGVDYFCNTHPHGDHLGGFMPLVQSGFPIGSLITFFDHDYIAPSAVQVQGMRTAEEWHVPVIDHKTEDVIDFGGASITFYRLLPEKKYSWKLSCNDLSAMMKICYGDCSILLTGDVEVRSQGVLAKQYDLKADILKVPHHGVSKMELNFLGNVDPEYAFVTGGANGSEAALKQLKRRDVRRVSFSPWGMITMQTDGTKWIVSQDVDPEMNDFIERFKYNHPWWIF